MFKRNVFCVGLVGTLAVLSFMVGVWDGINIKPRRRPAAVAYYKDDIIINNIEYNLPNRNSRGKIEIRDLIYVNSTMNNIQYN